MTTLILLALLSILLSFAIAVDGSRGLASLLEEDDDDDGSIYSKTYASLKINPDGLFFVEEYDEQAMLLSTYRMSSPKLDALRVLESQYQMAIKQASPMNAAQLGSVLLYSFVLRRTRLDNSLGIPSPVFFDSDESAAFEAKALDLALGFAKISEQYVQMVDAAKQFCERGDAMACSFDVDFDMYLESMISVCNSDSRCQEVLKHISGKTAQERLFSLCSNILKHHPELKTILFDEEPYTTLFSLAQTERILNDISDARYYSCVFQNSWKESGRMHKLSAEEKRACSSVRFEAEKYFKEIAPEQSMFHMASFTKVALIQLQKKLTGQSFGQNDFVVLFAQVSNGLVELYDELQRNPMMLLRYPETTLYVDRLRDSLKGFIINPKLLEGLLSKTKIDLFTASTLRILASILKREVNRNKSFWHSFWFYVQDFFSSLFFKKEMSFVASVYSLAIDFLNMAYDGVVMDSYPVLHGVSKKRNGLLIPSLSRIVGQAVNYMMHPSYLKRNNLTKQQVIERLLGVANTLDSYRQ